MKTGGLEMKTTFDRLYDMYHHDVYQYIFYLVKNKEVTEDLVQDTYIKVLKGYDTFRGDSSEKTWLFSIARFTVMDFFRSNQRKKNKLLQVFENESTLSKIKNDEPMPEEVASLKEEIQELYLHLDELSLDQRNVLILRYLQSMTIQETASVLEWTDSKVKTTQHRALKKLRQIMTRD